MFKKKLISKCLTRVWDIGQMIAIRFVKDRFTYSASALTYTTLLALVPFMAVCFTILSAFPVMQTLSQQLQQFVFSNFIPEAGVVIQKYLQDFVQQAGKLPVLGTLFLLIVAALMMLTIERALNDVWKVQRRYQDLSAWLRYWAVLSLVPILIGVSLGVTSYIISLPIVMGAVTTLGINTFVISGFPIFLTFIVFSLLYIVVPNCKVPIRHGLAGALVATILFELGKKAFVFYVTSFPTYRVIYGTMVSIPIFLVWIYLSWVIILFGALISNVLTTYYFIDKAGCIDAFSHAFLWLGYFWQAQQKGKVLSLSKLYELLPGHYEIDAIEQLDCLQEFRFIHTTDQNEYMLARDFSKLTLAELYEQLPWKLPSVEKASLLSKDVKKILEEANVSIHKKLNSPLSEIYQQMFSGN